jgi:hypothetical protein
MNLDILTGLPEDDFYDHACFAMARNYRNEIDERLEKYIDYCAEHGRAVIAPKVVLMAHDKFSECVNSLILSYENGDEYSAILFDDYVPMLGQKFDYILLGNDTCEGVDTPQDLEHWLDRWGVL